MGTIMAVLMLKKLRDFDRQFSVARLDDVLPIHSGINNYNHQLNRLTRCTCRFRVVNREGCGKFMSSYR